MKKSVENLKTSKITGGLRHPLKTRQKFETDRYPNEAEMGEEQQTITRKTRGNNRKTGLKIPSIVNLVMADSKVKRSKIIKVLENQTNNDIKDVESLQRVQLLKQKMESVELYQDQVKAEQLAEF